MKTLIAAGWVAPMDGAPIRDGGIVIDAGKIRAAGPTVEMRRAHPDAAIVDRGDCIVLPGLINAHTHLELSMCAPGAGPAPPFIDWIRSLRHQINAGTRSDADAFTDAVRQGIAQCLRFGVTCVGDISQRPKISRPLLRQSRLRAVSYGEALGLAARRHHYQSLLPLALDRTDASDRLNIGLSPHAPFTVDLPGYQECLALARQRILPLATHLAETPFEEEFLRCHGGPFRRMFEMLGYWAEPVETFAGSPIEMAKAIGLLDYPTLLAHVNYCTDVELETLAAGMASVVYCPRTHAYFGHRAHRWREMLARNINVAIGTDSCASSPDLNIVDELRLLHRLAEEVPARTLWEMVTVRAARAIGLEGQVGAISPGMAADFVLFDGAGADPLLAILESDATPREVWIEGELVGA